MHRRTILIAAAGTAGAFLAALILAPELVYDNFIWKYFVGPVVADALDRQVVHNGVRATPGYTLLSEMVYGLFLLIAFYGMYRVLRRLKIQVDARFIGAASPYIVLGATLRALEDSGLFQRPLTYLFISPVIYIQIGVYLALGLAVGILASRASRRRGRHIMAASLALLAAAYTVAYLLLAGWCTAPLSPLIVAVFALAAYGCFELLPHDTTSGLFTVGLFLLLPSLYLIGSWMLGYRWGSVPGEIHLLVLPVVAAVATGITGLVYTLSRWQGWHPGTRTVNLALVFGHMVDGWVSYLAVVDPLGIGIGYTEKHPIPELLMEHGGGIAYPLAKLGIVIGIIYALDVYLHDELRGRPLLTGLIKLFVLVLGLSPGLRDLIRIGMGI